MACCAVAPGPYRATELEIEPDVSTASYFLASAALTGTTVTLPGLDLDATRQGDIELVVASASGWAASSTPGRRCR